MYSDIYKPVSFKLGMMVETARLYILDYLDLLHSCMKNEKLVLSIFTQI